jgi:hypothetical protein
MTVRRSIDRISGIPDSVATAGAYVHVSWGDARTPQSGVWGPPSPCAAVPPGVGLSAAGLGIVPVVDVLALSVAPGPWWVGIPVADVLVLPVAPAPWAQLTYL